MRVFWALMAGLAVAAGLLLAVRGGDGPSGPATPAGRIGVERDSAATPPVEPGPAGPAAKPAEAQTAGEDPGSDPVGGQTPAGEPGAVSETEPASGEPTPAGEAPADAERARLEPARGDAPGGAPTLTLNGRYRVFGAGTEADPYRIDFDALGALEQDYAPKTEGKTEVPEWIRPLDGKVVEMTGFIAFPFIAPSSEECMVMLNQWDGCCIGVPPTPYDAVEVHLREAVSLANGVPNYGTVRGVFRTDPYLVNGWLIGLYVMEDARLINAGSRNQTGF